MLDWKTCKYYYETDELPNPRPTQGKLGEKWHLGHFSQKQVFFRGLGFDFIWKTDHKKPNPNQILRNTPVKNCGTSPHCSLTLLPSKGVPQNESAVLRGVKNGALVFGDKLLGVNVGSHF